MTAFADFLDLQTAVIEHIKRPDIADVMPRLVLLAENTFNRRLRCREQMTSVTLTIAGGEAPLPVGFQEAIGLFDAAGCEYVQQPVHMVKDGHDRGFYAISGTDLICLADGDKTLDYYAAIPTLTTAMTTTNWLLIKHPGLYLYAVGYEAAKYAGDVDRAQLAASLMNMEFNEVTAADHSARYSRARIRLPGVTP